MFNTRIVWLASLVILLFTQCNKDGSDFTGLRVTIDGSEWTATVATGITAAGKVSLTASDLTATKVMLIVMPENISTGTYDIGLLNDVQCTYTVNQSTVYAPTNGTLKITEHNTGDKRIKGTFSFEATSVPLGNNSNFTDGEFNVGYQ